MEELRGAVLEAPEVYKYYGDILLPELLKVLNHAWEPFKLPDSMNEACIIVLLKPDSFGFRILSPDIVIKIGR